MATILGVILFVSILYSSIVPMFLTFQQAENYKKRGIEERDRLDQVRENEELDIFAYPVNTTSNQLRIRIGNTGHSIVEIKRIWIQDTLYNVTDTVNIGETEVFGPYTVDLVENASYPVKAVTGNGNVFSADMISLVYTDGQWYTPSLGINVYISNEKGKYYILVNNATWSDYYQTLGMDFGDLIQYFEVVTSGIYTVTCRRNDVNGTLLPGTPVNVEIQWPDGPPIIYVYTSGK
jgi:archaellum component FlaF (FlaF/FlaG flagellin family)